jgi:hypothetical protein
MRLDSWSAQLNVRCGGAFDFLQIFLAYKALHARIVFLTGVSLYASIETPRKYFNLAFSVLMALESSKEHK